MFIGFGIRLGAQQGNPWAAYTANGFAPEVVADFKNQRYRGVGVSGFAGLLTFARASDATYVNSNGVLQTAASGVARLDHHAWNGSAWVREGQRFESAAATNLCLWSQDLTNAAHTKNGCSAGAPTTVGPDGNTSLNPVTLDSLTTNKQVINAAAYTVTTNALHATHAYVRLGTQRYVSLWAYRSATNWSCAVFDLQIRSTTQQSNGAGSGTIYLAGMELLQGDLLHIYMVSSQAGTSLLNGVQAHSSDMPTLLATDGTEAWLSAGQVFTCGFRQDEAGKVPSSYIATTTVAVTRAAETMTIAAAKLPWNAAGVSMAITAKASFVDTNDSEEVVLLKWLVDDPNRLMIRCRTTTGLGQAGFQQLIAGVATSVFGAVSSYTPGLNVSMKMASRHSATEINGAHNGVLLTALVPTGIPDLTTATMQICPAINGINGTIELVRVWGVDIGDAGIAEAAA